MDLPSSLEELRKFTFAIHSLSDEEWSAFASIFEEGSARRKTILTSPGEVEKCLYFVLDGVQRAYHLSAEEKESTLVFTYPYSFSGVADSFLTQTPSRYYLETLTQSNFLKASYHQVAALMDRYPNFERFIRIATSHALKGALERQIELMSFSAEQKFRTLLTRSPQVLRLIPHKYLASYLGIDAATFSKLLSSVRV
jgi:CRP-like cAMP-binding protein